MNTFMLQGTKMDYKSIRSARTSVPVTCLTVYNRGVTMSALGNCRSCGSGTPRRPSKWPHAPRRAGCRWPGFISLWDSPIVLQLAAAAVVNSDGDLAYMAFRGIAGVLLHVPGQATRGEVWLLWVIISDPWCVHETMAAKTTRRRRRTELNGSPLSDR